MMFDMLYTFLAFIFAVILCPGFALLYFVVRICHNAWLQLLSTIHPDLEFIRETTVRTLVDTRRNQGIFTVLLRVEGPPQVDLVRRHLQDLVSRVDKLGEPRFPKLRRLLVSRWGSYAWKRPQKEFLVEQVLVVGGKSTHRGRPLTESNVKEHVSDIITRYLPRCAPPWQLVILPCAGSQSHYLLLRMHHLLLTDGDVNIADLLPLATTSDPLMTPETLRHYVDSPLLNVLERPDHIRALYETVTENLTNRWNEFTASYDPLNRPELLKASQSISGYLTTVLIAVVSILRKLWLGYNNVNPDLTSRLKYVKACIKRELYARGIGLSSFFESILVSIHPWNVFTSILGAGYLLVSVFLWKGPIRLGIELQALFLRAVGITNSSLVHSTTVDTIWDRAPLIWRAANQVTRWCRAVYTAPGLLLDETLRGRGWPGGTQVPLCGRKVVSWSQPIPGARLREISDRTGKSCTEVLLACLGAGLNDYYTTSNTPAPSVVPITARRISSSYLFSSGPNVRPQDAVSGFLCLRLPTIPSATYPGALAFISNSIVEARQHQVLVYLASVLQTQHRIVTRALPSVLVTVLFRFLSKKYTVAVTELIAGDESGQIRYTTWGSKISDIIYWRPPQANISLSLCLNYYGDEVTLAVMSDALLSPHHVPIAEKLPGHVEALAKALGLPQVEEDLSKP